MLSAGLFLRLSSLLAVATIAGAQDLPEGTVRVERCPDGGIQPKVFQAKDGVVHLVTFKGEPEAGDLYYSRSDDTETFSEPLRVNSVAGSVDARDGFRGANITVGADRVHVVWVGSASTPEYEGPEKTPLLYARMDDEGAFEPQRSLIASRNGLSAVPAVAADSRGRVHVFWHAPGDAPSGRHRLWRIMSEHQGDIFSDAEAIDPENGVTVESGLVATVRRDSVAVLYQLHNPRRKKRMRGPRLLWSIDRGITYDSVYVTGFSLRREPRSALALSQGGPNILAAWEQDGDVYWAGFDKKKGQVALPMSPRPGQLYRRWPAIASGLHDSAVLAWMESPNFRQPPERLVWQAFRFSTRTSIGLDRVAKDISPNTCPAVFVRRDAGFTVLY